MMNSNDSGIKKAGHEANSCARDNVVEVDAKKIEDSSNDLKKIVSNNQAVNPQEIPTRYSENKIRLAVIIGLDDENPIEDSAPPRIKSVLEGLNFRVETCKKKYQTNEGLPEFLNNIKKEIKAAETECFILVLTGLSDSKDKKDTFKTRDGEQSSIWIDIVQKFNNHNCKELINVPKIFILQLYRDPKAKHSDASKTDSGKEIIPSWTDMLVCNSKIVGSHPFENPPVESPYMSYICDVLEQCGRGNDICKLLDLVSEIMKERMKLQDENQQEFSQYYNIGFSKEYYF